MVDQLVVRCAERYVWGYVDRAFGLVDRSADAIPRAGRLYDLGCTVFPFDAEARGWCMQLYRGPVVLTGSFR